MKRWHVIAVLVAGAGWVAGGSAEPAADGFWTLGGTRRLVHRCTGDVPVVLCMQGRKTVMEVNADPVKGFSYSARFFHVGHDPASRRKVMFKSGPDSIPAIAVDGKPWLGGALSEVAFDGMLGLTCRESDSLVSTRTVYPSTGKALVIEEWQVRNTGGKRVNVTVAPERRVTPAENGVAITWTSHGAEAVVLEPGGVIVFAVTVQAGPAGEPEVAFKVADEHAARQRLVDAAWMGACRLETPEPALDAAFALQKFHVLECPIETIKGLISHNGSLTYSPGIWANDPVEYSSPLFPFLGDAELNRAGANMYRVWLDHCRQVGTDPYPGSFEGPDLRLVQRERGDDAMVLYGLSKFLLFLGDRAQAEELWPLVELSAASVLKHTRADGIVASKTDEMEGRYPTGDANLSTSALAYGGYRLAACLGRSLGRPVAAEFDQRAAALRKAIDGFFGAEIEGFRTYRYYEGNTTLRGWILLPPAMGINERLDGTVEALLSRKLWPDRLRGGDILAESTRPTEWGRETYYALRVLFAAGRVMEALDTTRRVVSAQIFGPKGPYPDEDAIDMLCPGSLYPRVFTEGVFGIIPTGLDSFTTTPRLPDGWPRMALRDVRAFGHAWDLVVERDGDHQRVTVSCDGRILLTGRGTAGTIYSVRFP